MSRIDEIKARLEDAQNRGSTSTCTADLAYLLARVAKLEAALRVFADVSNWRTNNPYPLPVFGGNKTPWQIAAMALEE